MQGWFWGLFDQRIGLNQISHDWRIMGYGAKWLGGDVFYEDASDEEGFSDYALCRNMWRLLDEADIVVTQNGVRFDIRKINARFLQHGLNPPRPFRQVDTKVAASKIAMNTSNKLEYLAEYVAGSYKDKHAKFSGFELWKEWLAGNKAAHQEMADYCKQDVIATEALYLKLRPWIYQHPNVAMYYDDSVMRCKLCGSTNLEYAGDIHTQVNTYKNYRCMDCGGFSRERFTRTSKDKRKVILV